MVREESTEDDLRRERGNGKGCCWCGPRKSAWLLRARAPIELHILYLPPEINRRRLQVDLPVVKCTDSRIQNAMCVLGNRKHNMLVVSVVRCIDPT